MEIIIYKTVAAILIFSMSIVAVLYPLKTEREIAPANILVLGEALASGIFLGIAFFHLLPYSITLFHNHFDTLIYPVPEVICAGGFLLLLFLERLYLARSTIRFGNTIPYFLITILIIHSLTEGLALGLGQSILDTMAIFIAIIAYKGSTSFALCTTLLRYRLPSKSIVRLIIFFSLMTPIGIAIGGTLYQIAQASQTKLEEILLGSFNAFAAGTFIYMSTMYHIQFHQRLAEEEEGEKPRRSMLEFSCYSLGLIAMAVLAIWT